MLLNSLDETLFLFFNHGLNLPVLDQFMVFVTDHNPYVYLALFLVFWRYEGRRSFIVLALALAAFGLADWTAYSLKQVFMRPRPCNSLENVVLLVRCSKGFSLPSNHAANSFAVALPFLLMGKGRFRFTFIVFAALVAYSRVYVGVHYPFDILSGALWGSAIALTLVLIYRKAVHRGKIKSEHHGQETPSSDSSTDTP